MDEDDTKKERRRQRGSGAAAYDAFLRQWHNEMGDAVTPPDFAADTIAGYRARFRLARIQDAAFADLAGTSALRTSGRPAPAEDCVRLWVVRRGMWDLGDDRRSTEHTVSPGRFLLRHVGPLTQFATAPHTDAHLLVLPAAELTPLLGARTVSGDAGSAEVRMLLAYAGTVRRLLAELGPAALLAARTALIELTRALVHGAVDPQLTSPIAQAAKALIEQRLTEPGPDPATLARELHVSVRTLQRAFAAEGTSLTAYVRDRRLELACRALSSPARSSGVSEVASRLQFADSSHFSRAFKQRYGTTPAAFARSQAQSRL